MIGPLSYGLLKSNQPILMEPFNLTDLLLTPSDPTREYQTRGDMEGNQDINGRLLVPHWGQMKLLLHELWFFTQFGDAIKYPNAIVIYVGAAEGTHIPFLVQMFPWISQWHLYDPRPFSFDQPGQGGHPVGQWSEKVILYTGDNGKFTDEVARNWLNVLTQENQYAFFISDIRDLGMTDSASSGFQNETAQLLESNRLVEIDMRYQEEWYQILHPRLAKASLKFRLPYPVTATAWNNGGNVGENPYAPESYYNYLYGYMFKQPFSRSGSTEVRLIPENDAEGNIKRFSWKLKLYDDLMYYFTMNQRPKQVYPYPTIPSSSGDGTISVEAITNLSYLVPSYQHYNPTVTSNGISWDMAAFLFILSGYFDYSRLDPESGLVPFIWAMLSNLNVVGYNRPDQSFVMVKGQEMFKEWNSTAVALGSLDGITSAWHPQAGTTWQLFLGQNTPNQFNLRVYRLTPKDIERARIDVKRRDRTPVRNRDQTPLRGQNRRIDQSSRLIQATSSQI